MMPRNRWRNVAGAVLLVAVAVFASGCAKQFFNINKNKGKKLLSQAETQFNAKQHPQAKPLYDQATNQLATAEAAANGGDYKTASAQAREAVRSSKDALNTAKRFEATKLQGEADHEVQVMKDNNGAREDPELYDKIIQAQAKMKERYAKERWVATIEIANRIKEDVDRLLLRLRRQAKDDQVAVEAEYKRLLTEQGREYALMYVQQVEDLMREIDRNYNPPVKNYLSAIQYSKQAMMSAQDGITEAKRKRCEEKIERIQRKLIDAQNRKAEFFQPELWSASSDDFARLVENFWKKEYDFVLTAADQLENQVDTLIYETRKTSARYQIDKLNERITDMKGKGVEEYLPGQLGPVEKRLEEARTRFTAEAFEEVEDTCKSAQLVCTRIMGEFRTMAEKWITTANKITQVAEDLFKNMQRIFDQVHTEYEKPLDQKLEDNKEALRSELGTRLTHAREDVARAELRFNGEEYKEAIETSRKVENDAKDVIATIYDVVAHNVISELADQITRYDREGADEYAKAEMALTKQLLAEAIELRNQKQFQASASKAAEARAELERTIEAIQSRALQAIQSAEDQLKLSDNTKTAELRPDSYQRAQALILQARTQREATELAAAIQTARNAEELIRRASQEAAKIWAEQTRAQATAQLEDARNSGAHIYSAQLLNDAAEDAAQAAKVFEAAEALLGQQKYDEARDKYVEAKDLATLATEGAGRAKFRLIDEAEAAIVEARAYDAWKHNLPELTHAVLALEQAKEAMEADGYAQSHELAQRARAQADKITAAAKAITFSKRLEVIDGLIADATGAGGRYYKPEVLAGMAREIDQIRTQYDADRFDSNSERVSQIEAHLQEMVDAMPEVVAGWLEVQHERLREVEAAEIPPTFEPRIAEARKFLRFADLDYKRGKYRNSYVNLRVGVRIVDELVDVRERVEYRREVEQLLTDLQTTMKRFDHYLSLRPRTLINMTKGPEGDDRFIAIAGQESPKEFREQIEQMMVSAQAVHVPGSLKYFHAELEEMLRTAREGAMKFEQLRILQEFRESERRKVIEEAHDLIRQIRERRGNLERVLKDEVELAQHL